MVVMIVNSNKFTELIKAILLNLVRPIAWVWMKFDTRTKKVAHAPFKFSRREPYVIVSNHTFLFDVVHVPMPLWKIPYIVASDNLFTKQPTKFLLTHVARVIAKSKGTSDIRTVKGLINAVKSGYPILIFPEGDTTFYGETNYIEEATFKLIKKLKVDVVTCHVKGGYLSRPRWARVKRTNRKAFLDYQLTIPKDELKKMSVQEISEKLQDALYNNDYEFQREKMIKHPSKALAEGIEDVLYICPKCHAINSFESEKHTFRCTACNHEGHVDEYGFLDGFQYDNLVDWNHFQKEYRSLLLESKIESSGDMFELSYKDGLRNPLGHVNIVLENGVVSISGPFEKTFAFEDVMNPTLTLRRDFTFSVDKQTFLIKLDHSQMSILRALREKY
jgi:1-acyl-sn-glycerol-3-phosphate acyltransferase